MGNSSSGGISFFGALFMIFLTLKLTNHIDWSWWWVTIPLWGGLGLLIGILASGGLLLGIVYMLASIWDGVSFRTRSRRRRK